MVINSNLKLVLLHSELGYKNNISLKRLRYSKNLSMQFKSIAKGYPKPDIIYCSWPLIDFAYEATQYGQANNVPVVIDIRDLWPDIFIQPFPSLFQPIVEILIKFIFEKKVAFTMRHADVVIGVIPKILGFAKSHGRILQPQDHSVYLAYDNTPELIEDIIRAEKFWEMQGLVEDQCIISYIGTISNRIGDFDTLIEAAEKCTDSSMMFVLCGTGNYFAELTSRCKHLKNVLLPGYQNKAEIQALLKLSSFGLLPYRNTDDFIDSIPSKFSEYLSEGLIILTSLKGTSRQLLEKEHCGAYYHDASSLLECIARINNAPPEKKKMSQNALNLFHREFDASRVYSDFYKFLEATADAAKNKG